MERILLPPIGREQSSDAIILKWHVAEGTPLTRHHPLVTIQVGKHTRQYMFRRKGHGFVVKKLVVTAGEQISCSETLALVGHPDESLPESSHSEPVPRYGTGAFLSRSLLYFRILRNTLFCAALLFVSQIGIDVSWESAGEPTSGILLALKERLQILLAFAFPCLIVPIFVMVGLLVLFLPEPTPKHMLEFRRLPVAPEQPHDSLPRPPHEAAGLNEGAN